MMINAAIIGYGLSGKTIHRPLMTEAGIDIVGIVTSKPQDNHIIDGIEAMSFEALLRRDDIALAAICAPNALHAQMALALLKSGKSVVVEKPLALTAEDARAVLDFPRQPGQLATVFHNRRWDGDFLTVKHLLSTEDFRDWKIFESNWRMNKPIPAKRWKDDALRGGGLINDFLPHLIDQALDLFGLPDSAFLGAQVQRTGGAAPDYLCATLNYGARRVILNVDCFGYSPGRRFRLAGSVAEYFCDGVDPQESQLRGGMLVSSDLFGVSPPERRGELTQQTGAKSAIPFARGCYHKFYAKLTVALSGIGEQPVSLERSYQTVEIICALRDSGRWSKPMRNL